MQYGVCNIGIAPLRRDASDASEMTSQVLYGEYFKILKEQKKWSYIRLNHDGYEGWISRNQLIKIEENIFTQINESPLQFSNNIIDCIETSFGNVPISLGAVVSTATFIGGKFSGKISSEKSDKQQIINTAYDLINAPYLWGGRSILGIDCSGLVQLTYRVNGYHLTRDASTQAEQGEVLGFIEEAEAGDLAFFDDSEGNVTHVGILLSDHRIIHASGRVRIDTIDHSGIFNKENNQYTHKLKFIRRVF